MNSVPIGYFPKRVCYRPEGLNASGVLDICSASCCISKDPEGWIDRWLHNDLWVFSTEEAARQVLPPAPADSEFEIHAYRMFPVRFDNGSAEYYDIPKLVVQSISLDYQSLGYDAVARSSGTAFECSPLSCNHGAEQFIVNQHCLVDDPDRAMELAEVFSREGWEPGPYYVVEVLRRESRTEK